MTFQAMKYCGVMYSIQHGLFSHLKKIIKNWIRIWSLGSRGISWRLSYICVVEKTKQFCCSFHKFRLDPVFSNVVSGDGLPVHLQTFLRQSKPQQRIRSKTANTIHKHYICGWQVRQQSTRGSPSLTHSSAYLPPALDPKLNIQELQLKHMKHYTSM